MLEEIMPFYNYGFDDFDGEFNDFDEEFGGVKKKVVKARPKAKRKGVVEVWNWKPTQSNFRKKIFSGRQSTNVEDRRGRTKGMHAFDLSGYLTWNTFFHLKMNCESNITNALRARGFNVFGVNVSDRDASNSQYNFEIFLQVLDRYSNTKEVVNNVTNILEKTVALPGSIRVFSVHDYWAG